MIEKIIDPITGKEVDSLDQKCSELQQHEFEIENLLLIFEGQIETAVNALNVLSQDREALLDSSFKSSEQVPWNVNQQDIINEMSKIDEQIAEHKTSINHLIKTSSDLRKNLDAIRKKLWSVMKDIWLRDNPDKKLKNLSPSDVRQVFGELVDVGLFVDDRLDNSESLSLLG